MVEEIAGGRHRRWLGLVVAVAVVAAAASSGLGLTRSALRATPWPFDLRAVGEGCPDDAAWVCGSIRVPLDRAAPNAKSIGIHFRVLPRRDRFATPTATIVVVNGGPGFPSTELHAWAQKAFGSLLGDHDLLLVDNRGTGASGRIDCPEAQKSLTLTLTAAAQCRTLLGAQADDYGTIAAADDLEAVLERIHASNVDLYGESYGTFFAQVFALRHPQLLQRMVSMVRSRSRSTHGLAIHCPRVWPTCGLPAMPMRRAECRETRSPFSQRCWRDSESVSPLKASPGARSA